MKKVTSSDVARVAGVSQAAVSLILNGNEKISFSQETRDRVHAAAKELGYVLPQRKKREKVIPSMLLVFTPTMENPYYPELVQHIEEYAQTRGCYVMLCNTFRNVEMERYYLEHHVNERVAGIVYAFLPSIPELVEQISATVPTVIIGEKQENLAVCSVGLNNIDAGALLTDHLYQLGHRHIAFLSTPLNRLTMARSQRLEGIRRQMTVHHIEGNLELLISDLQEQDLRQSNGSYEYTIGRVLAKQFLSGSYRATALIAVNDMTALGILTVLSEAGVRVPEDVSVCSFDNIFPSRICSPGLTTIEHHLRLLCHAAVDMLINPDSPARIMPGDAAKHMLVKKIEYSPRLITRGSTGPVKK